MAAPGRLLALPCDHQHVEALCALHKFRRRRGPQQRSPAASLRLADQHAGRTARACVFDQGRGGRRAAQRHGACAQRFSQAQDVDAPVALRVGQAQQRGRLHVDGRPLRVERVGDPLARAHELLRLRVGTDGDQQPVAGQVGARWRSRQALRPCRRIDTVCCPAQREFAQCHQVRLAEEAFDRRTDLVGHVDLALLQALQQVVRGQVDQLDLVGLVEHVVRYRLALTDTRNLRDQVVETFEVLDVERRPHIDAGVAEFRNVLPALGMPRRRLAVDQVRVRQLIDQQDPGVTLQRGVEVEFLAHHAAIADRLQRQALQRLEHALGLATAVRLDVTDHDVGPRRLGRERRLEHRVGLADSRRSPEEDTQPPAACPCFLGLHLCQQSVRIRAIVCHPAIIGYRSASSARFSSSTFTRGSPRTPSVRPAVAARTSATYFRFRQPPLTSHARHLEFGRGDGNLGVEAAA